MRQSTLRIVEHKPIVRSLSHSGHARRVAVTGFGRPQFTQVSCSHLINSESSFHLCAWCSLCLTSTQSASSTWSQALLPLQFVSCSASLHCMIPLQVAQLSCPIHTVLPSNLHPTLPHCTVGFVGSLSKRLSCLVPFTVLHSIFFTCSASLHYLIPLQSAQLSCSCRAEYWSDADHRGGCDLPQQWWRCDVGHGKACVTNSLKDCSF